MLGTLIECLIPTVLLIFFKIYNFSLVPSPGKILNIVDFYDIYLFGALLFWCYESFIKIWEAVRNSSEQFLFKPVIVWIVSAGAVLAFYIKKVNNQKKLEYALKKIQELDAFNKDLNEKNLKLEQYKEIVNTFAFLSQSTAASTDGPEELDKASKRYQLPQIKITRRELSVIELIVGGKSNKEIADFLALSEGRVRNIITKIFGKLNVQDRTQVAVYALDNNLVKRD
jgi:DNA-binding CsgD family transcriptional regulator